MSTKRALTLMRMLIEDGLTPNQAEAAVPANITEETDLHALRTEITGGQRVDLVAREIERNRKRAAGPNALRAS